MKTEEILSEREKTHGDYKNTARLSWSFKHTVREELDLQNKNMRRNVDIGQQEAIEMILHKIARIICGDPNFADHWDDIAGYAMLGKGKDCGKNLQDICCKCREEVSAYYTLNDKIYCEECFTLDEINQNKNSTSSKMEHVHKFGKHRCTECGGMGGGIGSDSGKCYDCDVLESKRKKEAASKMEHGVTCNGCDRTFGHGALYHVANGVHYCTNCWNARKWC